MIINSISVTICILISNHTLLVLECMHKMQLIMNSSTISASQYKNYMKINLFKKKYSMYLEISYLKMYDFIKI